MWTGRSLQTLSLQNQLLQVLVTFFCVNLAEWLQASPCTPSRCRGLIRRALLWQHSVCGREAFAVVWLENIVPPLAGSRELFTGWGFHSSMNKLSCIPPYRHGEGCRRSCAHGRPRGAWLKLVQEHLDQTITRLLCNPVVLAAGEQCVLCCTALQLAVDAEA